MRREKEEERSNHKHKLKSYTSDLQGWKQFVQPGRMVTDEEEEDPQSSWCLSRPNGIPLLQLHHTQY